MVFDLDCLQPSMHQEFVNVGGSGFQALAVWFIDTFESVSPLLSQRWMKTELVRVLLRAHFDYFPAQKNYSHCVQQLILNVPRLELLASLTYTFACIAMQELCLHPARYRALFFKTNVPVIESLLIQPDRYCIAALARALSWPMEIYDVGDNKVVHTRFRYYYKTPDPNWPWVVLQLNAVSHFRPLLPSKAWHLGQKNGSLNTLVRRLVMTYQYHHKHDLELTIINADKALLASFDYHYARLKAWVTAGELTLQNLKAMYIGYIRQVTHTKRIGTEYGHQDYFNHIFCKYRDITEFMLPASRYSHDLTHSLLHALARGLSLDEISSSALTANRSPASIDRSRI